MNDQDRRVLGIDTLDEGVSLRDAVVAFLARDEERERARAELRRIDEERWQRVEINTTRTWEAIDDLRQSVGGMSHLIDQRVCDAIAAHEAESRSGDRTRTTVLIVVGILLALAVAATLEFTDRDDIAAVMLLVLMPVITMSGWFISRRYPK